MDWVSCYIAMHNPLGLVFHNDQDVEQSKRCRHDDTEVTGQYVRRMSILPPRFELYVLISRRLSSVCMSRRPSATR